MKVNNAHIIFFAVAMSAFCLFIQNQQIRSKSEEIERLNKVIEHERHMREEAENNRVIVNDAILKSAELLQKYSSQLMLDKCRQERERSKEAMKASETSELKAKKAEESARQAREEAEAYGAEAEKKIREWEATHGKQRTE